MEKQHLDFLRLKFYDRTRVLNARIPELANKNYLGGIHVELEFTILKFLLCTSSSFAFSRSFFFFLRIWFFGFSNCLQLHVFSRSVLQIIFRSFFFFFLQIWFFGSLDHLHLHAFSRSILQIVFIFIFVLLQNSSLRNSSSTWINYSSSALELESLRLNFVIELKLHRFKMLVS